jgi:hypothetical protein
MNDMAEGWCPKHGVHHGADPCEYCRRYMTVAGPNGFVTLDLDAVEQSHREFVLLLEQRARRAEQLVVTLRDAVTALIGDFDAKAERFRDEYARFLDEYAEYPEASAYNDGRADSYDDAAKRSRCVLDPPPREADS